MARTIGQLFSGMSGNSAESYELDDLKTVRSLWDRFVRDQTDISEDAARTRLLAGIQIALRDARSASRG